MCKIIATAVLLKGALVFVPPAAAGNRPVDEEAISYLKSLSIEELLETEITSVSKKREQLFDVAAAVSVITQEDLRRAGVRTIPDALRMVPGVQVAHIDASRWAITVRGFADYFANKLLVLIDGRSVYTPLFSGVYWDVQDTMIEDIERIEVIRGPGATVWGANAVNGVVNIITKRSRDTQGGLLVVEAGSQDRPMAEGRYGGTFGDKGFYRLWVKGFDREEFQRRDGGDAHDGWRVLRGGFAADWQPVDSDLFTVQGGLYDGGGDVSLLLSSFLDPPYERLSLTEETFSGGHLLGRWEHAFSTDSATEVQLYYDRTSRDQIVNTQSRDTIDLEFKHNLEFGDIHDLVWGVGYRLTGDSTGGTFHLHLVPESRNDNVFSAFVQDEVTVIPQRFWLTFGTKFEHNDYSGFEVQPSLRARLQTAPNQMLWAAVSRAVRTPSRGEHDLVSNLASVETNLALDQGVDSSLRSLVRIVGDRDMVAEELVAYEAGFRWRAMDNLTLDFVTFYDDYSRLRTSDPSLPYLETSPPPPHLVLPQIVGNSMRGNTYGFEFQGTWQVAERLKLSAAYSWLNIDLEFQDPGRRQDEPLSEDLSPKHQANLRAYLDLPLDLDFDVELYYVDRLEGLDVDGYLRLDARLAWRPVESLEISLCGENLFDDSHLEFIDRSGIVASEVPTIYSLNVQYSF